MAAEVRPPYMKFPSEMYARLAELTPRARDRAAWAMLRLFFDNEVMEDMPRDARLFVEGASSEVIHRRNCAIAALNRRGTKPTGEQYADSRQGATESQNAPLPANCHGSSAQALSHISKSTTNTISTTTERDTGLGAHGGTPPTAEEVTAFFNEHGMPGPSRFYDYYSARGWTVNDAPVRDWQALARNWARRDGWTDSPAPDRFARFDRLPTVRLDSDSTMKGNRDVR